MIAKSDLIILAASATLLAAGIFHWQTNLPSTMRTSDANKPPATRQVSNSQVSNNQTDSQTGNNQSTAAQGSNTATASASEDGNSESGAIDQSRPPLSTPSTVTQAGNSPPDDAQSAQNENISQPLYGSYTIESGDTLGYLARTFGTTVETLRTMNGISGSRINVGQVIQYPLPN